MLPPWGSFAPSPEVARRYRDQGWWRDTTFSDDLRKSAAERPDDTALLTWRHRDGRLVPLSFREFDERADAVAGALLELGVRRGEVVAHQLPTWWEAAVLTQAGKSVCGRPAGRPTATSSGCTCADPPPIWSRRGRRPSRG